MCHSSDPTYTLITVNKQIEKISKSTYMQFKYNEISDVNPSDLLDIGSIVKCHRSFPPPSPDSLSLLPEYTGSH